MPPAQAGAMMRQWEDMDPATAEINRLRDEITALRARLTAERDAIAAAAFEVAAQFLIQSGIAGDAADDPLASCIRSLTPADAQAALDRMLAAP